MYTNVFIIIFEIVNCVYVCTSMENKWKKKGSLTILFCPANFEKKIQRASKYYNGYKI